jgi:hypothetical protein
MATSKYVECSMFKISDHAIWCPAGFAAQTRLKTVVNASHAWNLMDLCYSSSLPQPPYDKLLQMATVTCNGQLCMPHAQYT